MLALHAVVASADDAASTSQAPRPPTSEAPPGTRAIGSVVVDTQRDGRLAIRNKPPVGDLKCCVLVKDIYSGELLPAVTGKFDTTEMFTALAGYNLYYAQKLAYTNDTREARVAMRRADTKARAAASSNVEDPILREA